MLSVLLQGALTADPVTRTSSKGSAYATAQLRAAGEDGEAVWCGVIAFDAAAVADLAALKAGDSAAIAGLASLNRWESKGGEQRCGLKVTAQRVLSVYQAGKQRRSARENA